MTAQIVYGVHFIYLGDNPYEYGLYTDLESARAVYESTKRMLTDPTFGPVDTYRGDFELVEQDISKFKKKYYCHDGTNEDMMLILYSIELNKATHWLSSKKNLQPMRRIAINRAIQWSRVNVGYSDDEDDGNDGDDEGDGGAGVTEPQSNNPKKRRASPEQWTVSKHIRAFQACSIHDE